MELGDYYLFWKKMNASVPTCGVHVDLAIKFFRYCVSLGLFLKSFKVETKTQKLKAIFEWPAFVH